MTPPAGVPRNRNGYSQKRVLATDVRMPNFGCSYMETGLGLVFRLGLTRLTLGVVRA